MSKKEKEERKKEKERKKTNDWNLTFK